MEYRKDDGQPLLFRQLQGDLPVERRPFRDVAALLGENEEVVLERVRALLRKGTIRKFGAILKHQAAGITQNAMVVWAVPSERTDEAGGVFAAYREITHCYERRPPFQGRYNLFTMIHAGEGMLPGLIAEIAVRAGISDYQVLYSEEEFKKSSMVYF